MKPGYRTTEFWLTMATNLWAMFGGMLTPEQAMMAIGIVNGAYSIARGLAKGGILKGTVGPDLAKGPEKVL
jgi:hypothetical protein